MPKYTKEDFRERMICLPIEDFVAVKFDYTYIIDPILPVNGMALIHGKGGHGKTQIVFSMIRSILNGYDFLGKWKTRQGKVIYCQFDMPHPLYAERWERAIDAVNPDGMLHTIPWRGIDILDNHMRDDLKGMIADVGPKFIAVDTLRKCHRLDENDNGVPSAIYGAWKEIAGDAAVMFIHHDKKSFSTIKEGRIITQHNWEEGFRGARAWVDDCELGLSVYMPDQKKNRILLRTTKKYCAPELCPDETIRLNPETLLAEPIWTSREWAVHYILKEKITDRTELAKLVENSAGCSRQMAGLAVKEEREKLLKLGVI